MTASTHSAHNWRFFRAGGFDQVCIDNGADLLALNQLDQKLWGALSCPVHGIEFDARTLEFIDHDKDGYIRVPEVISAVNWAASLLRDPDVLIRHSDALPLDAINTEEEEGRLVLAAAQHVLQVSNCPDATSISVSHMDDVWRLVAAMHFNGDGVIPAQSVQDEVLHKVVEEIIACCGAVSDRSGEPGITADIAKRFFTEAQLWADWWKQADEDATIHFLGADTAAAYAAFQAMRVKVEDYFVRCRLAAYDARSTVPLNRSLEDYQVLAAQSLTHASADMADFPLASISAQAPLPLVSGVNPAWEQQMRILNERVIAPILGDKQVLTQQEWEQINAQFSPLEKWLGSKPACIAAESASTSIEQLGAERVRTLLNSDIPQRIQELIEKDTDLKEETEAIASLDKLVHYCRYLHTLVNNFVSFRDFYTRKDKAIFQAGTLYLDGRSCDLVVRVNDVEKHAALANLSRICLAYCECFRKGGSERMFIAAAFTAGDSDQLMVGRNGVFYDRQGRDWNATIVRMLEHPISIRQAFWLPYKRVGKMISEQIQKFAAARSQDAETRMLTTAVETTGGKTAEAKPPFDVAKFAGIFAAIGLAVGALGTAIASMMTGLMGLQWWQLPIVVVAVILAISGPSVLLAWLKLRQRNLGPILDANGWAVNTRAKINIPFGTALTGIAQLPKGADRSLTDPYAEKSLKWPVYLLILGLIAGAYWYYYL